MAVEGEMPILLKISSALTLISGSIRALINSVFAIPLTNCYGIQCTTNKIKSQAPY